MSEAIDESVCSLVEELGSRCPGFAPAIFPTSFTPRALEDLCSTEEQREAVQQMWQSLNGFEASSSQGLVFRTTIDYRRREIRITSIDPALSETDCLLGSLERSMELIVAGAPDAVTLARQRFSALNEPTHGEGEGEGAGTSRRFAEAYNLAYAIKVLVSNTPMRVLLGPRGQVVVPLVGGREDFGEALGQVLRRSPRPSGDSDDDEDDGEGEGQGDGAGAGSGKKRRKKKRSGGGGGGGGKGRGN